MKKKMTRKEAREWFDNHSITEANDLEEVEVKVKEPLTLILSLRIDEEHRRKLSEAALAQNVGITQLARQLLYHALDKGKTERVFEVREADLQTFAQAVAQVLENSPMPGRGSHKS